jgi:hypothetical protein
VGRIVGLGAIALLCVGLISGCSYIHDASDTGRSVVDKAVIDTNLGDLRSDIRAMPEVTSIKTSAELNKDLSYAISAHITAASLTQKQAQSIVQRVTKTFRSSSFVKQHCFLEINTTGNLSVRVGVFSLSMSQLSSELANAFAVESAANGPVTLSLDVIDQTTGGDSRYSRAIEIGVPSTSVDWEAMRSLVDDTDGSKYWTFPGMSATESLPPKEMTDLLNQTALIVPPLTYTAPLPATFFSIDWDGRTNMFTEAIQSKDFTAGTAPQRTPAWPRVLEALALVAKVTSADHFTYGGSDGKASGTIHFASCSGEVAAGPGDRELYAAVVAAGVALRHGSGPGFCNQT